MEYHHITKEAANKLSPRAKGSSPRAEIVFDAEFLIIRNAEHSLIPMTFSIRQ